MTFETLVTHGSDWIRWVDASGTEGREVPVFAEGLDVVLTQAPPDLRILKKPQSTILERPGQAGMVRLISAPVGPADVAPPPASFYTVQGKVHDPEGIFLPRAFQLNAGGGQGHTLSLYRSPAGMRLSSGGGLTGETCFEDGNIAPWVLLRVVVNLHPFPSLTCVALSDERGAFILPLHRLPPLPKGAPGTSWPALLSARASMHALADRPLDPGSLVAMDLGALVDGEPSFTAGLPVEVIPGVLHPIHSPQFPLPHARIVLKPRP